MARFNLSEHHLSGGAPVPESHGDQIFTQPATECHGDAIQLEPVIECHGDLALQDPAAFSEREPAGAELSPLAE
jgi:hypothetical protein